jgi:hypothetical protein
MNAIKEKGDTIDFLAEEMACGISSGGDKIFRISKEFAVNNCFEPYILKKVLVGGDIDKYQVNDDNYVIIYSTKESNTPQYANIYNYLIEFKSKLSTKRETRKGTLPWWCLHWPRYNELFDENKIIMRQTSDSIRCVYDGNGYYTLDSILILKINKAFPEEYKFICTTLNSKLTNYVYKRLSQEEGRTFAQVKPVNVRKLYIPRVMEVEQDLMSTLYDYMVYLRNPQSQPVDSVISNQFIGDFFESIIDGCVYELFFKEHMKERGINILDFLYDMIKPIANKKEVSETIASVFNTLYKTDNEVRTRLNLFVSRSPEYLKNIIQS